MTRKFFTKNLCIVFKGIIKNNVIHIPSFELIDFDVLMYFQTDRRENWTKMTIREEEKGREGRGTELIYVSSFRAR